MGGQSLDLRPIEPLWTTFKVRFAERKSTNADISKSLYSAEVGEIQEESVTVIMTNLDALM